MSDFDLGEIQTSDVSGIDAMFEREASEEASLKIEGPIGLDALFEREPNIITATQKGRKKVASLGDLKGFIRLSAETLIHRSERDLWSLGKEADGQFYIQRLFDDGGEPLKG